MTRRHPFVDGTQPMRGTIRYAADVDEAQLDKIAALVRRAIIRVRAKGDDK